MPILVLDDDLLTPTLARLIRDNARHDVGHATGAEWHHNRYPLSWIILRGTFPRHDHGARNKGERREPQHANTRHDILPNPVAQPSSGLRLPQSIKARSKSRVYV